LTIWQETRLYWKICFRNYRLYPLWSRQL